MLAMFSAVKHEHGKYHSHKNGNEVKVFLNGEVVFNAKSENGILCDVEIIKNDLIKEVLYENGADIYMKDETPVFRMHQWISPEFSHLGVVPCSENVRCEAI